MREPKTEIKSHEPDFKKSLGLSLALHGIILSIFLIKFAFYSEPLIDFSQAISVNIGDFKESNRLPEKQQPLDKSSDEDSKAPQKTEEPAETKKEEKFPEEKKQIAKTKIKEVLKPDTVSLAKDKQKAALDKLKKSSALEKIRQELKSDSISKIKSQLKKSNTSNKVKVVAAGSALSGLDKLQANNYLQAVDQSIKQFWSLPQWLINKPLKAQALVKFNVQGQILSTKIISSSGNNSYDQYCIKAIESAAPFPKVPEKLTEKFSIDGVVIGFPE